MKKLKAIYKELAEGNKGLIRINGDYFLRQKEYFNSYLNMARQVLPITI